MDRWHALTLVGLSQFVCMTPSLAASAAARNTFDLQAAREPLTVRGPIRDNKVGLLSMEVGDDLAGRHTTGDIALYLGDALNGRHRLQIYSYNLRGALGPAGGIAYHNPGAAEDFLGCALKCYSASSTGKADLPVWIAGR